MVRKNMLVIEDLEWSGERMILLWSGVEWGGMEKE
jgi:hypothetical protein